jgi:tetratricopeptide (TPR) repeat protein
MKMFQRPRLPAIATLLLVLVAGIVFLGFARRQGGVDADLAKLQRAVAQPDAKPADWLRFADKLQQTGRFAQAGVAYQRVLENDPYNREARLHCAASLAQAGNGDVFYGFLRSTLLVDPKLTLNILGRPEVGGYLGEQRFQVLQKDAVAQSLD